MGGRDLSHASAILGDAGADVLVLDVPTGAGYDSDDMADAVEAMKENDIGESRGSAPVRPPR